MDMARFTSRQVKALSCAATAGELSAIASGEGIDISQQEAAELFGALHRLTDEQLNMVVGGVDVFPTTVALQSCLASVALERKKTTVIW